MEGNTSTTERVSASDLEEGDEVRVHVNRRASGHLGVSSFEAVVNAVSFGDIQFKRKSNDELHTWYSDIGYIHGYHTELERHSDIGKVTKLTEE